MDSATQGQDPVTDDDLLLLAIARVKSMGYDGAYFVAHVAAVFEALRREKVAAAAGATGAPIRSRPIAEISTTSWGADSFPFPYAGRGDCDGHMTVMSLAVPED